ncbi:hypothetical protein FDUTEX481_08816 [Tolypothrix sp. PCC 7601]|nr:hypothetical protein FDUTEX481_08816 [Tolypothrix sp. PCC 7601]BAY95431.1 hypothetical protein NIES3275_74880 [Microchaete diplosiphon NIES-3275]
MLYQFEKRMRQIVGVWHAVPSRILLIDVSQTLFDLVSLN